VTEASIKLVDAKRNGLSECFFAHSYAEKITSNEIQHSHLWKMLSVLFQMYMVRIILYNVTQTTCFQLRDLTLQNWNFRSHQWTLLSSLPKFLQERTNMKTCHI